MSKGSSLLFSGIAGLALALAVWRLTHSALGWAVLFGPAAVITLRGIYLVFFVEEEE